MPKPSRVRARAVRSRTVCAGARRQRRPPARSSRRRPTRDAALRGRGERRGQDAGGAPARRLRHPAGDERARPARERVGRLGPARRRAGRAHAHGRARERERRQRGDRLRPLRLLRRARLRLARERARARRRRARPRGPLLPALQRAAGRGAEGPGCLRLGRRCARGHRAGGAQAPRGGALRRRDARLRALRDLRGRGRRQPGEPRRQARLPSERGRPGNGRLPRRPRRLDRGDQPELRLAPGAGDARGALLRVPAQQPVARLRAAVPERRARGRFANDLLPVAHGLLRSGRAAAPLRRRAAPQRHLRAARQALLLGARLADGRHAGARGVPLPRRQDLRAAHAGPARRPPAALRQPARAGGLVPHRRRRPPAGHRLRGEPARRQLHAVRAAAAAARPHEPVRGGPRHLPDPAAAGDPGWRLAEPRARPVRDRPHERRALRDPRRRALRRRRLRGREYLDHARRVAPEPARRAGLQARAGALPLRERQPRLRPAVDPGGGTARPRGEHAARRRREAVSSWPARDTPAPPSISSSATTSPSPTRPACRARAAASARAASSSS